MIAYMHPLTNPNALTFILAGNAIFTLRSVVTDKTLTFRVRRAKDDSSSFWRSLTTCESAVRAGTFAGCYFVDLLTGPDNTNDYTYIGVINRQGAYRPNTQRINTNAYAVFDWFYTRLRDGKPTPNCECFHEGRCGKCGRVLTVPESIESGLGPICKELA